LAFDDELRCTEPSDVLAHVRSLPPGEQASAAQVNELRRAIDARVAAGGGTFTITKDTGCFVASGPGSSREGQADGGRRWLGRGSDMPVRWDWAVRPPSTTMA